MADDFASDLSYQVFQKRRRANELAAPPLDQSVCGLHPAIERLSVCHVTGARLDVLTERLTGEQVPLVDDFGDGLRGLRHGS